MLSFALPFIIFVKESIFIIVCPLTKLNIVQLGPNEVMLHNFRGLKKKIHNNLEAFS